MSVLTCFLFLRSRIEPSISFFDFLFTKEGERREGRKDCPESRAKMSDKKRAREEKKHKEEEQEEEQEETTQETTQEEAAEGEEVPQKRRRVMDPTYEPPLLVPIAHPLADVKLAKKLLRLIHKTTEAHKVSRGVKEVVKSIRKEKNPAEKKRLCVLAGDITPIDVIAHIPVLCEEHGIPYVFVRSRTVLGQAARTKRPTSVVLINLDAGSEFEHAYERCVKKVRAMMPSFD